MTPLLLWLVGAVVGELEFDAEVSATELADDLLLLLFAEHILNDSNLNKGHSIFLRCPMTLLVACRRSIERPRSISA